MGVWDSTLPNQEFGLGQTELEMVNIEGEKLAKVLTSKYCNPNSASTEPGVTLKWGSLYVAKVQS